MGLRGTINYTGRGGLTRLGDTVVPRHATCTVSGENGEPDLAAVFEVRDGRPECVRFLVEAKSNGRGIRTADLNLFNIDSLAEGTFTRFAMVVVEEGDGYISAEGPIDDDRGLRDAARDVRRARRGRTIDKAELERVADVYRSHVEGSPTIAVKEICGYTSHRTAARRIEQARAMGLLPRTTPGKRKA